MILLGTAGCGSDAPRKVMLGQPPVEKTAASEAFSDVQVLVNGEEAKEGIFTVRKGDQMMSMIVTMKVDKQFGPLELVYATTKQHDGIRWLTTRTSEHKKPVGMNDGKLKVTLDVPIPSRTGEHFLRIETLAEKHDEPVYVAGSVIRVVAEE